MLTESELRKAVRRGLYLRLRKEQPQVKRALARQMVKATERVAWARRDPKVIKTVRQQATPKEV